MRTANCTGADSNLRSARRGPRARRPRGARRRGPDGPAPRAGRAGRDRPPPSCPAAGPATRARGRRGPVAARAAPRPRSCRVPESRSAASRPSATACPCVTPSYPAAASSACANVWPRLSTLRSPRSCGSRRQTALLYAAQRRTSSGSGSFQSSSPASRPVFTTSASPSRRSRSGSVPSRAGSITVRTGQWNAPTRFLPSGRSSAVLPPIAASTWPTSVDGTATQRTPRRYVAATNPAASVVQPPPSATTIPERSRRSALQSRVAASIVFASSPSGSSCTST